MHNKKIYIIRLVILLAFILFIIFVRIKPKASGKAVPDKAADKKTMSLMFTGDFLFSKDYPPYRAYVSRGKDITKCIEPAIIKKMKAVDVMVMNNEFTYTNRGKALKGKKFTFRAYPEMAKELNKLGVDLVSLANNHAYDFGEISLLDTMDSLDKVKVPYVGAGKNIKEAEAPVFFEKDGIKAAILAATSIERYGNPDTKAATEKSAGVARCLNTERLEKSIAAAKKQADIVIVFVHWGSEGTNYIDQMQKNQAEAMVNAGADVIVGAHPHVLQKVDFVKGVPVVYSLGNFWFNSRTLDTGMFKVTVGKDGVKGCKFIPCKQSSLTTGLLSGKEKQRVLDFMQKLSPNVVFDKDGNFTKK